MYYIKYERRPRFLRVCVYAVVKHHKRFTRGYYFGSRSFYVYYCFFVVARVRLYVCVCAVVLNGGWRK